MKRLLSIALMLAAAPAAAESFPKPPAIAPNVAFWKHVYVEWSVNDIALHDEQDLGTIYRVVRVPARGTRDAQGRDRKQVVAAATRELEGVLKSLAKKNPKDATKLDGVEKEVFLNLQGVSRPDKYTRLSTIRAQNGLRERFVQGYQNSGQFEAIIRKELIEGGLPEQLIGVAFVESLFYMGAKSKVGAAGIWQFMSYTGREYMYLNEVIDERYDPILATEAAVKYLKQAKKELGEWPLVITSYNYGRGGMRGLADAAGTKDFGVILAVSKNKRFGFAARNYYASFLAVNEILAERDTWLKGVTRKGAWQYDVVRLPFPTLAPQIFATGVVDGGTFEYLNPGLTDGAVAGKVVLPTGMGVRVPKGKGNDLVAKLTAFSDAERKKAMVASRGTHKANGKQTIGQIAKQYGVAVETLASALGVDAGHKPVKGTAIAIPSRMAPYTLLPEVRGKSVPVVSNIVPDVMVASAAAVTPAPAAPTPMPAVAAPVVAAPAPVVVASAAPLVAPDPKGTVKVGRIRVLPAERSLPAVDLVSAGASFTLPDVDAVAGDPGADAPWQLVVPAPSSEPLADQPTS